MLASAAITLSMGLLGVAGSAESCEANYLGAEEPNAAIAATWWPPLRNVWTPVGWENHPFRFCVLYNGTIVADPHPLGSILGRPIKQYLSKYEGLGVQLTITPSADGAFPPRPDHPYRLSAQPDGGVGLQGWADNPTPVLWTEYPANFYCGNYGIVLRQEVFAHVDDGTPVVNGQESLYAWIRFSVYHVDELSAPEFFHLMIHLGSATQIARSMFHEDNLTVHPDSAFYPRVLTKEVFEDGRISGCYLCEAEDRVRLVAQTETGAIELLENTPDSRDYYLKLTFPAVQGFHTDLLLPMIPGTREAVEAERVLGYEGALRQGDAYWARVPETAAFIDTPERQVNEAVRNLIRFGRVITETNPETGERAMLTGSWNYDTLWPTPTSMTAHMLMDVMGYHAFVADNLEIFRNHQGTAKAPGESYPLHPGYFGAPRALSSVDWLTDHGAILHAVCNHALLSDDGAFTERWCESIVKACDFIKESRAVVGHGGVPGVLPPAVATDAEVPGQAVWNIAWNYKGLTSAVRLLQRIHHPRAQEFSEEAREYKEVFVQAYREHVKTMPLWTDRSGQRHPIIPSMLSGVDNFNHPFFLDAGPMALVFARLFDGDDPLMRTALAYYREGPNTRLYDPRGNMHQRAVLLHEISSCEPCYSFNLFASWEAGDRRHFLEGMYSLLVASLSPQTYIGCEHRHGIYGLVAPGALMTYFVRLAAIDDLLEEDCLHLMRLTPRAWIRKDYTTRFENIPTYYGPASLRFSPSDDQRALRVDWAPAFRCQPEAILLHVPPLEGLKKVVVNGESFRVKPGQTLEIH